MAVRRARGLVLRIVRRRPFAIAIGVAFAAPAVWLEFSGGSGAWWVDGLGLIVGATGVALLWTGLTGPRADWMDHDDQRRNRRTRRET